MKFVFLWKPEKLGPSCKTKPGMHNYHVLFLLTLSLSVGIAEGQTQPDTIPCDTFYWKQYIRIPKPERANLETFTASRSSKRIDEFMAGNMRLFPQFTKDSGLVHPVSELKKSLFPVEINGDDRVDMIFCGYSGGESEITRIYLNLPDSFMLVFEDYQYPGKMSISDGRLATLTMADPGCCDAYLYFSRQYEIRINEIIPLFVKSRQTVEYMMTESPVLLYPVTFPFRSVGDSMMVRASAALLNEPFNPVLESFGNIVARYKTRTRGQVLGTNTKTGNPEWWYVEIFPDNRPSASILYETEKQPTFVRGWVHRDAILVDRSQETPGKVRNRKK
jgi:hypothetical protein